MIDYLKLFYSLVGPKLLVLLGLMQVAAILEGFGISLMLPIIQGDSQTESRLASVIEWGFDLVSLDQSLGNILVALVLFFVLRAVILVAQSWYQSQIVAENLTSMRTELIGLFSNSKYSHISRQDTGVLSNVLGNELQRVNFALVQLTALMVAVTTSAVYVVIALLVAPVVTVFLAILAVPVGLVMIYLNRWTSRASNELTTGQNRQQSLVLETLRNIKYLKATGSTNAVVTRLSKEILRVGTAFRKLNFLQQATAFGLEPIIVLALAAVIYFFTEVRGSNVLEILFLLFVFRTAAVNLVATQPAYRKFIAASGSMSVYRKLRDEFIEQQESSQTGKTTPNLNQVINLRNVSYSYPGQSASVVDVSMNIEANQTVALVGPSGSGKSTTANIVASLLAPQSGEISLGGTPYSELDITKFRDQVGYVTQESVVFNASIEDNITLWRTNPDKNLVADVIQKTGLGRISGDANRTSLLGESGSTLSGGERQRLSIARELYNDSQLLILDEATSSVDSVLEKQIDSIINEQKGSKTILIIAHRLSTIRNADVIYVFSNGEIVQSGTFDELMEVEGIFKAMADLQSF
jgi:ABC-type multidrug transport system fused ATPase/permease subunit